MAKMIQFLTDELNNHSHEVGVGAIATSTTHDRRSGEGREENERQNSNGGTHNNSVRNSRGDPGPQGALFASSLAASTVALGHLFLVKDSMVENMLHKYFTPLFCTLTFRIGYIFQESRQWSDSSGSGRGFIANRIPAIRYKIEIVNVKTKN